MKFIKSNKLLLILIIGTILVMLYSYYSRIPIETNELTFIKGKLIEKPIESFTGGDVPWYYIEIKFYNDSKRYFLKGCSYDLIDKNQILNLKEGEFVEIGVKQLDIENNNELIICTIAINNKKLIDINDYNNCHTKYWFNLKPFILVMLFILVLRMVYFFGNFKFLGTEEK